VSNEAQNVVKPSKFQMQANKIYTAYMTSQRVEGIRTPFEAERIVVDLGTDQNGNHMELSIDLVENPRHPFSIALYAIVEPLKAQRVPYPRVRVIQTAANAVRIHLDATEFDGARPVHDTPSSGEPFDS
jgi:hypothetical protein